MKVLIRKPSGGQIRRRIVEITLTDYEKLLTKNQPKKRSLKSRVRNVDYDEPVNWESASVKIIFKYWNKKGWPFVKHRSKNSKTVNRIIRLLKPYTKKYETRQITDAIDLGQEMFQNRGFRFYNLYRRRKVEFSTFLKYKTEVLESLNKGNRNKLPPSWMDVFLKGRDYVMKNYHILPKEKNPHITPILVEAWVQYKRGSVNVEDTTFRMKMIKFSNMMCNFAKMNDIEPRYLAGVIHKALNKWKTLKLKRINFVFGRGFWSEDLPEILLKRDYHGYRGKKWQTDWRELNK